MKKLLGLMITTLAFVAIPSFADQAQLSIKTSGVKDHHYFLCIYGAGCYNINAANQVAAIPFAPMDLGNVKKFVITDTRNMQMTVQAENNSSCNIKVNNGQKVIINGNLNIKNNKPVFSNIHCSVA